MTLRFSLRTSAMGQNATPLTARPPSPKAWIPDTRRGSPMRLSPQGLGRAAHAGAARRAAMDLAETWLEEGGEKDGVILTTDADSQVAPSWIAENLAAFEAGAEAVLGRIDLDGEGKFLPEALHRRGALEDRYERILTEVFWLLDPLEHKSVASSRHHIGCEPWCKSHGLLPRWASPSRRPGRGQLLGHGRDGSVWSLFRDLL